MSQAQEDGPLPLSAGRYRKSHVRAGATNCRGRWEVQPPGTKDCDVWVRCGFVSSFEMMKKEREQGSECETFDLQSVSSFFFWSPIHMYRGVVLVLEPKATKIGS